MNNHHLLSSEYGTFRDDVQLVVERDILTKPCTILDPMAGTAPFVPFVETKGYKAYFNDILPLHYFINRAKTYDVFQNFRERGYDWFFEQMIKCMSPLQNKTLLISDNWIDDTILEGLKEAWNSSSSYDDRSATFLKAAILLCVRPFSSITKSNNPTWLKIGGISSGRSIEEAVTDALARFDEYYNFNYKGPIIEKGECVFSIQNAADLELPEKAEILLTSPPYCNRLDPLVLYGPENYFLSSIGWTPNDLCLVTSTKVKDYETTLKDFEFLTTHSEFARNLLTVIKDSPKKDDPGYYLKYYTRYFSMLFKVLNNALNNLSKTGKAYIVTQDNYHRGELINIDQVLVELFSTMGWRSRSVETWERHHMGLRNVSRNHAFVRPKMTERLTELSR